MTVAAATPTIDLGDDLAVTVAFTDRDGLAANPTTVTFTVTRPDGTTVDYTPADPEITNPGVGTFVLLFVPGQAGRWGWAVTGTGNGVDAAEAGTIDVDPVGGQTTAAPYGRWGMTVDVAIALTGAAGISSALLEAAEDELVDAIGWAPDPDDYDPTSDVRARGFGRAVAWQAAYRTVTAAGPGDGSGTRIGSESLGGDYSVTYAGDGADDAPLVAPRARSLLVRGGWYANVGATVGAGQSRTGFDDWQRNRI